MGGWKVPEPNQCRGRLTEAVLLFLVNLTRPIDQRHQPIPKFRSGNGRREEPKLVMKTTKKRVKVEADPASRCAASKLTRVLLGSWLPKARRSQNKKSNPNQELEVVVASNAFLSFV